MKTFSAKSSVKRAIIKNVGLEHFEAGKILSEKGAWYFEPAAVKKEEKKIVVKKLELTEERRKSSVLNPCKVVWDIAEQLLAKGLKRKDIIAACEKEGIAFYTARTQYQRYTQAVKASAL